MIPLQYIIQNTCVHYRLYRLFNHKKRRLQDLQRYQNTAALNCKQLLRFALYPAQTRHHPELPQEQETSHKSPSNRRLWIIKAKLPAAPGRNYIILTRNYFGLETSKEICPCSKRCIYTVLILFFLSKQTFPRIIRSGVHGFMDQDMHTEAPQLSNLSARITLMCLKPRKIHVLPFIFLMLESTH